MYDIFDEYKIVFLEETQDYLIRLNDDLIALEKDHTDGTLIDSIFRVLHTLKSSASAVGFDELGHFAHCAENLVQQIRNRQRKITPKIVNILFQVFDKVQQFINQVQSDKIDDQIFTETLNLLKPYASRKKENAVKKTASSSSESYETMPSEVQSYLNQKKDDKQTLYIIPIQIDSVEPMKWLRAELVLNHAQKVGNIISIIPDKSTFQSEMFDGQFTLYLTSDQPISMIQKNITIDLIQINTIKPLSLDNQKDSDINKSSTNQVEQTTPTLVKSNGTNNSIRVPIKKLDSIMHLVGELVVANSALKILERQIHDIHRDDPVSQEMSLIVDKFAKLSTSLQSRVLKTRMLPIHTLFNQYNRVVRDLSQKESKEINLYISGEETELDKKVIDTMGDPLTHLIRNAVDHGIETPQKRQQHGKSRQGTIHLSASQAGNHIVISIKDDGQGLDVNKIRAKAIEKGYFKEEAAKDLSDSEVFNVIFEPGFSTADKVSSVSGRGVGLDVVNNIINSLNGSVQIESTPNQGTEFIINLPLTLAISTVIVVEAGKSAYGIPIGDIRETIKVPENALKKRQCIRVLNWADHVIPVLELKQILDNETGQLHKDMHGNVSIIIVTYRDREIGLIVDHIMGKQEIVMKPLEEHYKSIRGISGAAILGDGIVILIADVLGVLQIVRDIEEKEKISNKDIKENIQQC
ncbi:chemotaxis protein CheW [bacterium]